MIKYIVFHPVRLAVILVAGTLLGTASFYFFQIHRTFDAVAIEVFDPGLARDAIGSGDDSSEPVDESMRSESDEIMRVIDLEDGVEDFPVTTDPRQLYPAAFGDPIPDTVFQSYLLLGVDASELLADAIILVLEPTSGGRSVLVSLPRDLWVWNMCRQRFSRINEGLGGCRGVASGAELMAIMVEDYTGIKVNHLARINFSGFARLVDAMGGITVCVEDPTRDLNSGLIIEEEGCHDIDGEMALAWVRSRQTETFVRGEWRPTASSDLTRQRRQQDVLFQLAGQASRFASPGALSQTLGAVSASVRLNSTWTFAQAVATGWRYRGITADEVRTFTVNVRDYTTSRGARVLLPRVKFTDQLKTVVNFSDF